MAMTLRLPAELDHAARVLADQEHRSLHGLIVNAVDEYIRRHGADVMVDLVADELARRRADLLDRLGKA